MKDYRTIWKYQLAITDDGLSLEIPKQAKILHINIQNDIPTIWGLVDPKEEIEVRKFIVIGTGWKFTLENKEYIGTCFEGPFVWHLFEVKEDK